MILLVGSTKGGAGKSTVSTNIAASLANQQKDILLFDADRQPTASEWEIERRSNHKEINQVTCIQRYNEIDSTILELSAKYENIIIDVAGRASEEFESALIVADIVIVPIRPSQADLNALHNTIKLITRAKRNNPKLQALAVLNQAPTNHLGKEIEQALGFILDYPEIQLMNTILYDRKIYRDALSEGLGVFEMNVKSESAIAAKNEIFNLMSEIEL